MYCSNCGKEVEVDSSFCRFCGNAVENTEEPKGQVSNVIDLRLNLSGVNPFISVNLSTCELDASDYLVAIDSIAGEILEVLQEISRIMESYLESRRLGTPEISAKNSQLSFVNLLTKRENKLVSNFYSITPPEDFVAFHKLLAASVSAVKDTVEPFSEFFDDNWLGAALHRVMDLSAAGQLNPQSWDYHDELLSTVVSKIDDATEYYQSAGREMISVLRHKSIL
jgi:hypothetical protein